MTLQEAVRSKRPFTHPKIDFWIIVIKNKLYIDKYKDGTVASKMLVELNLPLKPNKWLTHHVRWQHIPVAMTASGILRKDWQVEKKKDKK